MKIRKVFNKIESAKSNFNNKKKDLADKIEKTKNRIYYVNIIWNLISIFVFLAFTVFSIIYNKISDIYIYIYFSVLIIYIILFIILSIINLKDKKKFKRNINNFKKASRIIKNIIKITNFSLILIMLLSTFNIKDTTSYFRLLFITISISMGVFRIIFYLVKFVSKCIAKKIIINKRINNSNT